MDDLLKPIHVVEIVGDMATIECNQALSYKVPPGTPMPEEGEIRGLRTEKQTILLESRALPDDVPPGPRVAFGVCILAATRDGDPGLLPYFAVYFNGCRVIEKMALSECKAAVVGAINGVLDARFDVPGGRELAARLEEMEPTEFFRADLMRVAEVLYKAMYKRRLEVERYAALLQALLQGQPTIAMEFLSPDIFTGFTWQGWASPARRPRSKPMVEVTLHPKAIENYNKKALGLLDLLREMPERPKTRLPPGTFADRPVAAHLSTESGDIKRGGPILVTDHFEDDLLAVEVHGNGVHEILDGDGIAALRKISVGVAASKGLRDLCTPRYVESHLAAWVERTRLSDGEPGAWTEEFIAQVLADVEDWTILVPLTGIAIERPFPVGEVELVRFTREQMDSLAENGMAWAGEKHAAYFEDLRRRYQGRVLARFRCRAVMEKAQERAVEATDRAVGVLRFFNPAAIDARFHCFIG